MHRRKALIGMGSAAVSLRALASEILTAKPLSAAGQSTSSSLPKPDGSRVTLRPEDVLDKEAMKPKGQWYEATVPDTLDLAESAKLYINVQTNSMDPKLFYAVQGLPFNGIPKRQRGTWNMTPKNARTLPTLRAMCGSDYNLDVEYEAMRALMNGIQKDGLMYYPFDGNGFPKGTSYPQSNATMMFAMRN